MTQADDSAEALLRALVNAIDIAARRFTADENGIWNGIGVWVGDLEPELGQARSHCERLQDS
jgi:hypothetical protein